MQPNSALKTVVSDDSRSPSPIREPTSAKKLKQGSALKKPAVSLRRRSSLEEMPQAEKEQMFKWILKELDELQLISSRLVHQVTLAKADYDSFRHEAFIIRDTVSTSKKPVVEKFLNVCRHKFREQVDESNIQIELSCGYTKGDFFDGFIA
jgi:ribosomal protein S14